MTGGLTQKTDPRYEEEVSGCTASVGVLSKDKIYVVSNTTCTNMTATDTSRPTLVTRVQYWA